MEAWVVQIAVIGGILLGSGAKAIFPYINKFRAAHEAGEPAPKFEWYYAVSTVFAFILTTFFNLQLFEPLVSQFAGAEVTISAILINSVFTAYGANSLANDVMKTGKPDIGNTPKTNSPTT